MLTPALRVGEPDHRPMDRTCVSTGRSPETSGPSSPECTTPTLATVAEATPPRTGVLRARLLRPQASRDVVAHFLNRPATPSTLGPSRERTANGRRSSAGQHRVHSCDRRKGLGGATSARPGRPGFPQREPALPTETAREQSTRAQGRVILLERGLDRSPVAAPGQAVVRRTVP